MTYSPRFSPGDQVVVTGDEHQFGHCYDEGTIVKLLRFDRDDDTWICKNLADDREDQWVAQGDMEPIEPLPTDEEIARLFGVQSDPTPSHCPTCTCGGKQA